jgi:RNA polymerase sigma factor (sigma-70 family)
MKTETPCQPCELHAPARSTQCRSWDGGSFDLVAILQANRPAACPFAATVLEPIVAAVARRSAGLVAGEDLLADLITRVWRRFARTPALAPSENKHLRRLAKTTLVDVLRHETGRRRCTACGHYRKAKAAGGTCERQFGHGGEPHPHHGAHLDSRTEPQHLRPPCHGFVGSATISMDDAVAENLPDPRARGRNDSMTEAVREALARLTAENERVGLLVARNKIDGYTYEELAAQHGLSRDQVKRLIQQGLQRLRELLEDAA